MPWFQQRRAALFARLMTILNYDFCPWANRWVYWLKHPLVFFVSAAVGALSCGLFMNPQAFVAVAAIVLTAALGVLWPSIALRGLEGRIEFLTTRVREGQPARIRLRIRNRFPWPVWGLSLAGGLRQASPAVALARVAGWSDSEFDWDFIPDQRGIYPQSVPVLETGFPFGLWQARRTVTVSGELIVWPRIFPLDTLPDLTDDQPSEDRLTDRRAGDAGDLLGTRQFREGDSLRRIHWSQSARHQRLIVTERQAGVQSRARVSVDLDTRHHRGQGPDSSLEWTLRIAASLCESLHANHVEVECVLGHERLVLTSEASVRRMLDRMAGIPREGLPVECATGQCHCAPHRNEIVCTTDLGHGERSSRQRGRRQVVLMADGFDATIPSANSVTELPRCAVRPWLLLHSPADAAANFRQQWRRACRVA